MTVQQSALKRNRLKTIQGQETIHQVAYSSDAGAILSVDGLLMQGTVVTADISAAPYLVGTGSVLRIQVTADTYVAFGNPDNGFGSSAVSSTTSPAIKLGGASSPEGYYLVVATDEFVQASANPVRVEIPMNVLTVEGQ